MAQFCLSWFASVDVQRRCCGLCWHSGRVVTATSNIDRHEQEAGSPGHW
jgi:hypothetical protein